MAMVDGAEGCESFISSSIQVVQYPEKIGYFESIIKTSIGNETRERIVIHVAKRNEERRIKNNKEWRRKNE